jgi:NAD(P)H-dependent FMN reductase
MRLTAFNGSPRGATGNTARMLEQFLAGFNSVPGNSAEARFLCRTREMDEHLKAYAQSERVLLAFPLYVDSMPAAVKAFIEELEPFCGREGNPPLLFLVHSGFPEASHSRPVERYLAKLAKRLGCENKGTIIKPGSEGLRHLPEDMNRKLFGRLRELGCVFGSEDRLEARIVKQLAKPERFNPVQMAVFAAMRLLGITNRYWDAMLRKNNAYEKRFDRPYAEDADKRPGP